MEPYSITITGVNLADLTGKLVALAQGMYAQQQAVQQQVTQQQAPAPVQPQAPAQPVQPQAPAAAPTAPTAVPPAYTLAQLQTASGPLIDAGKNAELQALLAQFGISALTGLPEEQYGAFATALRQLGAKL